MGWFGSEKDLKLFSKVDFLLQSQFPVFFIEYTKARIFLSCYQMHVAILASFFLDFVEGNQ